MFPFRSRRRPTSSDLTSGRRAHTFRPRLEALEDRRLLSASGLIAAASSGTGASATTWSFGIDNTHDVIGYETTGGASSTTTTTFTLTNCGCAAEITAGTDSSGKVILYGITGGDVWENAVGAATSPSSSDWTRLSFCGCATDVNAGYNGVVYGVSKGDVWMTTGFNSSAANFGWTQLSTTGIAGQISGGLTTAGKNELWVTSAGGNLFFNNGIDNTTPSTTFTQVTLAGPTTGTVAGATRVSAGINGEAFTLESGELFEYTDASSSTGTQIGTATDIVDLSAGGYTPSSTSFGEVWFVHATGTLDVASPDTGGAKVTSVDTGVDRVAATQAGTAAYRLFNGNFSMATITSTTAASTSTLDTTNRIL